MWYYTVDGNQLGPFDEAAFNQLTVNGTIAASTLVWKEGMANWAPLSEVRGAAPAGVLVATPSMATCSLCGKAVGSDNLIEIAGNRVCAACKPLAVQSLREGVSLATQGGETAWRDGKRVVTLDKNVLPPRCYKCNQPTTSAPITRKLYWHPPLYYILIFVSIIIYVIVAILVRKRASIDVHICEQHRQKRRNFMIIGWVGSLIGIFAGIIGLGANMSWLAVSGFVLFLASLIAGIVGAPIVRTARIKENKIWLAGAGKEFLASLSPWSG